MLAGGHVVTGATIYQAVRDKPRWLKWSLVVAGGFLSHWVLDSVIAYHFFSSPLKWYDIAIILANILAVGLLWWLSGRYLTKWWQKLLPPHMIAGAIAWLIWDIEWVLPWARGHWFHLNHNPIVARYFPAQSVEPMTAILEICFMVVFMLIAVPREGAPSFQWSYDALRRFFEKCRNETRKVAQARPGSIPHSSLFGYRLRRRPRWP